MTKHRFHAALLVLLTVGLATPAWAAKNTDEAPEEAAPRVGEGQPQRTLAERIPSVTHRAFAKRHRVELLPILGMSLNDPFYRYITPGLGIHFYILETLAVGLSGEYYAGIATPIENTGGAVGNALPTFNKPNFAARLGVTWSPLYGKISWLAEGVLHFDTYLTLSGGVVAPAQKGASASGGLALGQHYFINSWLAIRLEIRDEIYQMVRDTTKNETKNVQNIQNLLSASVGLSFFLPQDVAEE